MTSLTIARRMAACATLAAAGVLAPASASQANVLPNCDHGACVFSFDKTYAIDDVISLEGCAAQFGTSATRVGEGEQTGGGNFSLVPGNPGFHFHQRTVENTRITSDNGMYALDALSMEFTYNTVARTSVFTYSQPVQEKATVYTADGQATGNVVRINALAHFTWRDMDGNGDPTPGDDFLSYVDNLRVTCS